MKDYKGINIPPAFNSEGIPPVVIVQGSNFEMGYQYGKQLAPKIYSLVKKLKTTLFTLYDDETVINDMRVEMYFSDKYTPGFRKWIEGMSNGCTDMGYDVTVEDMMLIAVFTSETYERPIGEYPKEVAEYIGQNLVHDNEKENERHFCTTFGVAGSNTKTGKSIIAGIGGSAFESIDRVILIAYPDEGYSYITCSTIGKNHDQMALNTAGLAWVFSGNYSGSCDWRLMPEPPFHHISQYCSSIEEVDKFVESVPRCGAFANFVLGNASGEISCIESNAEYFCTRKPGDLDETGDYLVNTNHFASKGAEKYNLNFEGMSWREWNYPSITRFATASQYLKEYTADNEMDIEHVCMMFASDDWYDPETEEWHYNDPGSDPVGSNMGFDGYDYTVQAAFEPENMMAYFMQGTGSGTGMPAGSKGQFIEIKMSDDPMETATHMEQNTFLIFAEARKKLRKAINGRKDVKENYLLRRAFEDLLDTSYAEYELGQDRRAYAFMERHGKTENMLQYNKLLAEAMSHFARAQVYAKTLIAETKVYCE